MDEKPRENPFDAAIHAAVAAQPDPGKALQSCGVRGDPAHSKSAHIDMVDGVGKSPAIACGYESLAEKEGLQVKARGPKSARITFTSRF